MTNEEILKIAEDFWLGTNPENIKTFARRILQEAAKCEPVAWKVRRKDWSFNHWHHMPVKLDWADEAIPLYEHPAEPCAKCAELEKELKKADYVSDWNKTAADNNAFAMRELESRLSTLRNEVLEEIIAVCVDYGNEVNDCNGWTNALIERIRNSKTIVTKSEPQKINVACPDDLN